MDAPSPQQECEEMPDTSEDTMKPSVNDMLRLASEIVSAYVGNNSVPAAQIPELIQSVYRSLIGVGQMSGSGDASPMPATSIKKSITPDYLICLEDGKKLKMLKRHLRTVYSLTPQEYRAKWNLPPDYPMVAPNYASQRSAFAKSIGLGRSPGAKKKRRARN
jgi:predicted transcriptional regulator